MEKCQSKIHEPTELEQRTAERVRQTVLTMVDELQWTDEELAEKLGLLPAGAMILKEQDWDLVTAWRVAEVLKLSPRLNVVNYPRPKTKQCSDCIGVGMVDHWDVCGLCQGTGRILG